MFVTACDMPASLVRSRPRVALPDPVLAVTVHWVAGVAPTAVTVVIAGVPPRPPFTGVRSMLVRPLMGPAKVTVHDTALAVVGLLLLRTIEETATGGRVTTIEATFEPVTVESLSTTAAA